MRKGRRAAIDQKDSFDRYFAGVELYGDAFDASEIEAWFEREREGYAGLGAQDRQNYAYHYHALNAYHGFSRLPARRFHRILGFGSAYGDELRPILPDAESVTIVDPSRAFVQNEIAGVPVRYVAPRPDGVLPLDDGSFDLICCFGVLHHIPNVSFVMGQFARVLEPGGYALVREPIVSMGDWRQTRPGLTRNERGIPYRLFRSAATSAGLELKRAALCDFSLSPLIFGAVRADIYNSGPIVATDAILSRLFSWNVNYHPRNLWQRIRPASAALILRKPD